MAKTKNRLVDRLDQQQVTRASMGDTAKELMMAVLVRNVEAFQAVRDDLKPAHFESRDPAYGVLWRLLDEHYNATGRMPEHGRLLSALDDAIENDPGRLNEAEIEEIQEFLDTAYDDDTFGDTPVTSEYYADFAIGQTRRFLEERIAMNMREAVRSVEAMPVDLPDYVGNVMEQIQKASALGRTDDGLAFDDNWDESIQLTFSDPGLSYFKKFMGNGQLPGEVYGLLAPYGVGKTTIAVQMVVEQAKLFRQQYLNRDDPEEKRKVSVLVTYEETRKDIQHRLMGYAAEVPRERMETMTSLSDMSTSESLEEYEREKYKRQLQNDEPVLGEQERMIAAKEWLNEHVMIFDMSGHGRPGVGQGGVGEISRNVSKALRRRNAVCGVVVVDYVLAMIRRALSSADAVLDAEETSHIRHMVTAAPMEFKTRVAMPFDCPVWLLQQLSGEGNSKSPTAELHHTMASESKSWAEHLNFSFVIGAKTRDNLCVLACTKARRRQIADRSIILVDGRWNRMLDQDRHYVIDPSSRKIVKKSDYERVNAPPDVVQAEVNTAAVPTALANLDAFEIQANDDDGDTENDD